MHILVYYERPMSDTGATTFQLLCWGIGALRWAKWAHYVGFASKDRDPQWSSLFDLLLYWRADGGKRRQK